MRVLVAFDKFKGSLTAPEACEAAAAVLRKCRPEWRVETAPLSDGGDGFARILTEAAQGELRRVEVSDARGRPVSAAYGLVQNALVPPAVRARLGLCPAGRLAVVEMAEAAGLRLLSAAERDPWRTSTWGVGELLRAAAGASPAAILLGAGGSATHDLGIGALEAFGLRGVWDGPKPVGPGGGLVPAQWSRLKGFTGKIDATLPLWIASDVSNPLLGNKGSASVFAPQKGLAREDLPRLERETKRVAHLLCQHFSSPVCMIDEDGSGAAGGLAVGLRAAFGARITGGFHLMCDWLGLDEKVAAADLVITGEGRFDASSLNGKGPGSLLHLAERREEARCLVLAGRIDLPEFLVQRYSSCSFRAIAPADLPLELALRDARGLLEETLRQALNDFPV